MSWVLTTAWSPPLPNAKSNAPFARCKSLYKESPSLPTPILIVTGRVFSQFIFLIVSNIANLFSCSFFNSFSLVKKTYLSLDVFLIAPLSSFSKTDVKIRSNSTVIKDLFSSGALFKTSSYSSTWINIITFLSSSYCCFSCKYSVLSIQYNIIRYFALSFCSFFITL